MARRTFSPFPETTSSTTTATSSMAHKEAQSFGLVLYPGFADKLAPKSGVLTCD